MTYHDTIIDLLHYILSQGKEYYDFLNKANAYNKIIRNYHQVNKDGLKVYRTLRAKKYYKFSKSAYKKSKKEWLYEHLLPVAETKKELEKLIGSKDLTKENIKKILNSVDNEIVVITKEEQKIVDMKFRTKSTGNNFNRLEAVGIELAEETIENTIFS